MSTVVSVTRAVWAKQGVVAPFIPFFEGSAITFRSCKVDLNLEDVFGEIGVHRAIRTSDDDGATWSAPQTWGGMIAAPGWSNASGYPK